MLYAFGVGEVPISVSGDIDGGRLVHTVRAVGAVTQAICASQPGRGARRARAVRQRLAGRARPRAATSSSSRAASASRRCARRVYHAARATARDYGEVALLYGAARPATCSSPRSSSAGAAGSTSRSTSPSTRADDGLARQVGVVPKLIARRAVRPRRRRSRWSAARDHDALHRPRACSSAASPPERIYVSMERNMKCGVGHCGHCQLGPTLICRDGPVYRYDEIERAAGGAGAVSERRASRSSPSGSSPPATAASSRCSTARTSCSRSPARSRSPTSSRRRSATVRGPVRPLARRGLGHDRARRRADPARCAAQSRTLVTIGACATAGGIQALQELRRRRRLHLGRLRHARVHLDARDLDADLGARPRRLRAARLPDRQAPAARGDHRVPARAPAEHPVDAASASSASGAAPSA